MDKMRKDAYEDHRAQVPFYPFRDEGEWELAKFLSAHLNQSEINQFLKSKWVCCDRFSGDHPDESPF